MLLTSAFRSILVGLGALALLAACQSPSNAAPAPPAASVAAAEQAQKYTCPMHPEVSSEKPGRCPKCGMSLVPADKK